jgi:hypothetical protein
MTPQAPTQDTTEEPISTEAVWYEIGYVSGYNERALVPPDRPAWASAYRMGYTHGQADWRGLDAEWAAAWYAERSGFEQGVVA